MARSREEDGQASVELVALLPLLATISLLAWQGVVAGQAWWMAGAAARDAARAAALGTDPETAARAILPRALRPTATITRDGDGIRLRLAIPTILGTASLGTITARARMEPQA